MVNYRKTIKWFNINEASGMMVHIDGNPTSDVGANFHRSLQLAAAARAICN
jgi:hypothetical protein